MDRDFDEAFAEALASGAEVPQSVLEGLSGLEGVPLRRFQDVWEKLDPDRRAVLLARLGTMAEANLVMDFLPIFHGALADRDANVREQAFHLVAEEPRPDLIETYVRAALADPDDDVRLSAAAGLGQFALAAQTDDWPEQNQRQIETALLGLLKLPNTDLSMRRAALLSVSYLTSDTVEEEIRRASQDATLRDVAIEAMGRNCQPMWIPNILEALEDEDAAMRECAVEAAGELEDESLVPHLLTRLNDEDDEVRIATILALGTIGGALAKEALTDLLASDEREIRDAARDALEVLLEEENLFSN